MSGDACVPWGHFVYERHDVAEQFETPFFLGKIWEIEGFLDGKEGCIYILYEGCDLRFTFTKGGKVSLCD